MTVVTEYVLDVSARGGLDSSLVGRHCSAMSGPPDAPRDHALLKSLQGDESGKAGPTIKSKPFFGTQASCSPCSSNPASPTREDAQSGVLQSRRALRNEDSSYDSDFESSEVLGPASTASGPDEAPLGEEQHEDVSRTVSDTLAAEFAEYVTMQPNTSTTPVLPTATSKTIVTSDEVTSTTSCSSPVFVASSFSVPAGGSSAAMDLFSCSESTAKDAPVSTTVGASNALVCVDKSESVARTQPSESKPETTTAKSLLTSTSSLPSHSVLSSKGGINTGSSSVTIRPHTSVVSSLSSRPSSAPATQSLARSASTAVTSQAGSAPTSTSISTSIGKTWSGSESSIYGQQVEFGIKLGYSESLVQLALKKLGGKPAKNELLDELIRLGAVMPKSESELEGPLATPAEGEDAKETDPSLALRPIIIDGSNVAMSHGNKNVFSCRGLSVCVEWFRERGHKEILVFVPAWRKESSRWDAKITDQQVLEELEQQKVLVFTPSRTGHTSGRRIIPYDDRYILNEAVLSGGVVVSNDNFRDLAAESSTFRRVVEEALLMYSWVNGRFVPPDDPLGRNGPTLDAFLRRPVSTHSNPQARDLGLCPYGKKCTYGNKCKYQHPERGTQPIKSVTERLQEQREKHYLDKATKSRDSSPGESSRANNSQAAERGPPGSGKKPLSRTPSSHGGSSLSSTTACLPTPPLPHDAPGHDSRFSDASTSTTTTTAAPATAHQGVPSSPAPATTAAPLLMQQQHPMLSAQPSYDQSSLQHSLPHDVFKNQMFSSDSCLHPSFASQAHTVQHQHLHHQPSGPHQQSSSHTAVQRMQSYQQVAAAGGWGYQPPRPQDTCETSHFSELAMAERQPSDTDSASSCDNTHQKLRRQLTLNPSNDHRLAKINKEASQQKSVPMAGHFGGLQSMPPQYQQQLQTMNMASNQRLISQHQYQSPLQSFSPFIPEQNLLQQTPQSQMGPVFSVNQSPLPSHLYRHQQQQQGAHPHVARFSSAPDPIVGSTSTCSNASQYSHLPAGITRLNSTSDPHLNLYGSTESPHYLSEPYDEASQCRPPFFASHHSLAAAPNALAQAPVGSRPLSPQQPALLQQSRSHPAHQSSMAPLMNTSFPPPKSSGQQEERSRLYYHLINLFDEEIVLAALAKHPNETDVHKICSSILGFSASASNSSGDLQTSIGLSSQQMSSLLPRSVAAPPLDSTMCHAHIGARQSVPLPLRVPSPNEVPASSVPFSSTMAMPHEHSRLREYMNPQTSTMEGDGTMRNLVAPMTSLPSGVGQPSLPLQPQGQRGMHFSSQSHNTT